MGLAVIFLLAVLGLGCPWPIPNDEFDSILQRSSHETLVADPKNPAVEPYVPINALDSFMASQREYRSQHEVTINSLFFDFSICKLLTYFIFFKLTHKKLNKQNSLFHFRCF